MRKRYVPHKILVATDASDEAYPAVEAAVGLANGTGSELQVVFVISTAPELPYPSFTARERSEAILEQKRLGGIRILEHQVRRVEELGGSVAASRYREGSPEKEVVKARPGDRRRPDPDRRGGAAVQELRHSASFSGWENATP